MVENSTTQLFLLDYWVNNKWCSSSSMRNSFRGKSQLTLDALWSRTALPWPVDLLLMRLLWGRGRSSDVVTRMLLCNTKIRTLKKRELPIYGKTWLLKRNQITKWIIIENGIEQIWYWDMVSITKSVLSAIWFCIFWPEGMMLTQAKYYICT